MSEGELRLGASTKLYIASENFLLDSTHDANDNTSYGLRLGPANSPCLSYLGNTLTVYGAV